MRSVNLPYVALWLMVAAIAGAACAPEEKPVPRGTTPLHESASGGHVDWVERLLAEGADPNALNAVGRTPLHLAAMNGHGQTVSTLLDGGADADIVDDEGSTAYGLAIKYGHGQAAGRLEAVTTVRNTELVSRGTESSSFSSPPVQVVNPRLKYPDLESFERAIRGRAILLTSDHVHMYAPAGLEAASRTVFPYLTRAYDELKAMTGVDTEYILVVYHFPGGHAEAFGGTSNCVIWYDDANLHLDQHEEWLRHGIPHVSGYIEEMAHNFVSATKAQFGWEMVGWSIGTIVTGRVAGNPVHTAHVRSTRQTQADTYQRYTAAGNVFPSDIPGNLADRIHGHLLWQCEQRYGPAFWPDFFREVRSQERALRDAAALGDADAIRNERYRITVDCFDRLPGLGFKRMLRENGISRTVSVKSLHPTEPGWNRRLE